MRTAGRRAPQGWESGIAREADRDDGLGLVASPDVDPQGGLLATLPAPGSMTRKSLLRSPRLAAPRAARLAMKRKS